MSTRSNGGGRIFRALTLYLTAGFLLLSGCMNTAVVSSSASTPTPAILQSIVDPTAGAETAEPVELAANPVAVYYERYETCSEAALTAFTSYLTLYSTIDYISAQITLSEHEALLTKARVSIGRLTSDGSSFSDTLIGAATGYGTMTSSHDRYEYAFDYDSGDRLTGVFYEDRLEFRLISADGSEYGVTLLYADGVWSSCVTAADFASALEISDERVRFASIRLTPVSPTPTPRATPTPDPSDTPVYVDTPTPTFTPYSFDIFLLTYPDAVVIDGSVTPEEVYE